MGSYLDLELEPEPPLCFTAPALAKKGGSGSTTLHTRLFVQSLINCKSSGPLQVWWRYQYYKIHTIIKCCSSVPVNIVAEDLGSLVYGDHGSHHLLPSVKSYLNINSKTTPPWAEMVEQRQKTPTIISGARAAAGRKEGGHVWPKESYILKFVRFGANFG